MGGLIAFFAGGPARLQALLVVAMGMALVCAGLLIYGGYWHLEALKLEARLAPTIAQANVNAAAVEACSAGVGLAQKTAEASVAAGAQLLALARKANADRPRVAAALEDLARQARQPGEDCNWAWDRIERQRKAGAAP